MGFCQARFRAEHLNLSSYIKPLPGMPSLVNCVRVQKQCGLSNGASGKEPTCQCRRHKRHKFSPWVMKIPGGGHDNPLHYSCLENPMDRGAWWATVHGLTQSQTQLRWLGTHTHAKATHTCDVAQPPPRSLSREWNCHLSTWLQKPKLWGPPEHRIFLTVFRFSQ